MTSMTTLCNTIRLTDVKEVFQDYKKSALMLGTCFCDWKCCKESGFPVTLCQNHSISKQGFHTVTFKQVLDYVRKSYTDAVLFAGLEPFMQKKEVLSCVRYLREKGVTKDIVIYTGYYLEELNEEVLEVCENCHVILKCGRFIPNRKPVFDKVLGVTLASDNQYGVIL